MSSLDCRLDKAEPPANTEPYACVCSGKSASLAQASENECIHCCAKYIAEAEKFSHDQTQLMKSAEKGKLEAARFLIPYEAKLHNPYGETALMTAAKNGRADIAKLLIPHEAKMHDSERKTAMMCAAQNGHADVVELLAPREARMQDEDGWTATVWAAVNGHVDVVKLLLEREAGLKLKDGLTATLMAAIRYQPKCFDVLLANETERDANEIPDLMLSAYKGEIYSLLARRNEWRTRYFGLTCFELALLGRQRRAVRVLTASTTTRAFFAQSLDFRQIGSSPGILCFLSRHPSLFHDILPIIFLTKAEQKKNLLVKTMNKQHGSISRILRAVCTPDASSVLSYLAWHTHEDQAIGVLKWLKHVGFSSEQTLIRTVAKDIRRHLTYYLETNQLKQKQVEIAQKEAENHTPEDKQAAFREVEAESCFNREIVQDSRYLAWNASPTSKLTHDSNTNQIRRKQALNSRLLLDSFRFMQKVVQEMLDE